MFCFFGSMLVVSKADNVLSNAGHLGLFAESHNMLVWQDVSEDLLTRFAHLIAALAESA